MKKLMNWMPVVIAAAVAIYQAIGEKKEGEHIMDLEARIEALENK